MFLPCKPFTASCCTVLYALPSLKACVRPGCVCHGIVFPVAGSATRIMDTVSYTGRTGIKAEIGNFAIVLNYGIQAARHETNHSLNAGFTWKF